MANRLLLVGWDAADWKIIHELLDAGKLPTVKRLVEGGVSANLASLQPMLSPLLWTSVATGKRPYKHGVLGFSEVTPNGMGVRPATRFSRKSRAVWSMLTEHGLRSNVVGWWPSHPAEPINGATVSDFFHRVSGATCEDWAFAPESVYPREYADNLAELRVHPADLLAEHILPFVPRAAEVNQAKDRRLSTCAKILAECSTINAAATWLMQQGDWDFTAVYFDAIDHFCHAFMPYRAPRQTHISIEDFEIYQGVVDAAYRYHDMMLHSLLSLAGPDTTVLLISDHGFHSDSRRGDAFPDEPAGPAFEHRRHGVFVAHGPSIRRDELRFGLSLLDITPTVLTHFGLPVGEDMDGRPAVEIFTEPATIRTIPSWESGQQVDESVAIHADCAATAVLEQLADLGYVDRPPDDRAAAVEAVRREHDYNLARSLMDDGFLQAASEVLRRLWNACPEEHRFGVQLAYCYLGLGQSAELERLVDQLTAGRIKEASEAQAGLHQLAQEVSTFAADDAEGQVGALTPSQLEKVRYLRSRSWYRTATVEFLRGCVALSKKEVDEAVRLFESASGRGQSHEAMQLRIGEAFIAACHFEKAEAIYKMLIEASPDHPAAALGLARTCLATRQPDRAAEHALKSIGLLYHQPLAHYVLGLALMRIRRADAAVDALQVAVSQNPNFPQAHRLLARIYRFVLRDQDAARSHDALARAARLDRRPDVPTPVGGHRSVKATGAAGRQPASSESEPGPANATLAETGADARLVVVSGLPRSGTSLVMLMLRAGGLSVLTDRGREADESNPHGYLELERVKSLAHDGSWLRTAQGKGVKIVTPLLPYVPLDLPMDVLHVVRDVREVVASQRAMLDRMGKNSSELSESQLVDALTQQSCNVIREMTARPNVRLLHLQHSDLIRAPATVARSIADFLHVTLQIDAMVDVVDPSLHRIRR